MRVIPVAVAILFAAACESRHTQTITQEQLIERTQELFSAVADGNQRPWKKYFADDCMYFDETGKNMNKATLIGSIVALPHGYFGNIKIGKAQSRIQGDTAILSYDLDETETVFGQAMQARYHATDTWMHRNGEWRIVAGQVLRYYEDPAAGTPDRSVFPQYAGTYELAPGNTRVVSSDGATLFLQRGKSPKVPLFLENGDLFFRKGFEGRILFRRDAKRRVDALIDRRNNEDVTWKKTS